MIVYDAFPYWRERWAAEARLHLWSTLAPDVEYVPVAFLGDRTHRGDPLPADLPPVPDGVETLTVRLDAVDDWGREEQQRDAVYALKPDLDPDDLILLGDADELVDPRRLDAVLAATEHGPVKLAMGLWMCGTRWRNVRPWSHPAACRARDLPEHPSRTLRLSQRPVVLDAGWHLTYYGTDADIDAKLRAFAHSEWDTADRRGWLANLREHGDAERVDDPLTGPLADWLVAHV
jgi:hypothetical protein